MSSAASHVAWARAVLEHAEFGMVGAWPRAAALLGRQGLEVALDRFWDRTLPPLKRASRRTQLMCLGHYLRDGELAEGLSTAWAALSRACHHHAYELSPTAPELDRWLGTTERLAARLDEAPAVG